ncbi:MAG: queuosine precursor transporter [Sphaerochaetaceae bacterium]|nr:queuosine precursor transporter [Sphaerochaetaceae bacterium]
MEKLNESNIKKRDFLFALFIMAMVVVNTLGSKITTIFGVRVSVGIFLMPVLFLITDIIGEVFGEKEAQHFVNVSTVMLIIMFALIFLFIKVKPNETWGLQKEYEVIFSSSMRMTLASVISFVISQKLDVFLFGVWKKVTRGKYLWVRNNFSTIISQFIDTTIFDFIAFYHMNEKYTAAFVFSLIIPYWLFKVAFALLDTPFCYLGVRWMKGKSAQ